MRARRRQVLIERPRLLEGLAATPIAVLEAPGGYGKSTVCAQFAAALDVATVRVVLRGPAETEGFVSLVGLACRRAGLAALADAIDVEDPDATIERLTARLRAGDRRVLLTVDEVHRAAPDAARWLATLAGELPQDTRLVVAGRRLDQALATLGETDDTTMLGVDALRFDSQEAAAALAAVRGEPAAADEVEAILAATEGWPAAVVLAAGRPLPTAGTRTAGPALAAVLRGLLDGLLQTAGPGVRDLLATIGDLHLLSAEVLAAVAGEGALDRLLDAGIPIRFRADGWAELPDPVREVFPGRSLAPDVAREVARLYAERAELAEAVALLHRAGDHDGVAALLATRRRESLERAGLALFDAALSDVPDESLRRNPNTLVRLVQAAERQPRLRSAWVERAVRVLAEGSPARRAIDAERALDVARAGDLDGAARMADQVLAAAGRDEAVTRGRGHLTRALCALVADPAGRESEARDDLELAIGLFRLAGEPDWESESHQALGYGCHLMSGAFALAAERLERAVALRPGPDLARARTLTFLAEVLTHLGRLDDAAVALREATAIGNRLGDPKTIAYAAWSAAELHCQRRDRGAAVAALEEAEAHPEGWFEGLAGIDFLSNAAEIRTILGDEDGARRDLARAEERAAGTPRADAPMWARARLESTYGDVAAALRDLDALEHSPLGYRRDRWLRLLLRATCATRVGDTALAQDLLQRSRVAATELGDPERLSRREPELLAIVAGGDQRPAPASTTTVVLLGRFAVERDGVDVSPPPGRPATLVKLVALRRTITTDEAIDILWPEADLDTGRARLRNVLSRIGSTCGSLIDRRDGALSLAPGVTVDAQRFEEEAAYALGAPPDARAGLARRALARSTGELLPADRYAEWASSLRERLRRRHLALLDVVAEDAMARGDLDEAERLLDTAISTDPVEEVRYLRLARALLAQGRIRRARRVAQHGAAVAADLGVEPGKELRELLQTLDAHA